MSILVRFLLLLGLKDLATKLYFRNRSSSIRRKTARKLTKGEELRRHTFTSRDLYEDYTDREQVSFEAGHSSITIKDGVLQRVTEQEVRDAYLAPTEQTIRDLQQTIKDRPVRVLEIGCGNCINLKLLHERFGDQIALSGIDISPERLRVAQEFWGDKLQADLQVASATDLAPFEDSSFDLVFSSCCLEQIPYRIDQAVAEMIRVSGNRVVFVEPTFEFGNTAQKLYTIMGDQCRTLLPELNLLNAKIISSEPLRTLHTPVNMVGATIVDAATTKQG